MPSRIAAKSKLCLASRVNSRPAIRPVLFALIGAFVSTGAYAVDPIVPNAGSLLQQAQPPTPEVPSRNEPGINIEPPSGTMLPPSEAVPVEHIAITGNTKIDTRTLHQLVAHAEGSTLTLPELGELAAQITDYYRAHGYPLARAILPAQTISNGVVRIEIIEARYGKISLDNRTRVSDSLLQATLSGLQSGTVVSQGQMDRDLLLLSDIPGVTVNAALKPGVETGTSDLQVSASPTPFVTGNVTADNDGDRYTGQVRLGATVNLIDPLHWGDVLSVSGLSSGSDMNYGRVSYEALLDGMGTRVGASYSALDYRLGGAIAPLAAYGDAHVSSVWVKQPLIRSQNLNLYGQIQYDHLQLNDEIDTSDTQTNRHLDNVTTSLSGDVRDAWLAGSVNTWSASWTYGHVSFDNGPAQLSDASTTDTQGGFSKWNLTMTRLQNLGTQDALYLDLAGQWASGNLDPSQMMIAGGPNSVRAYEVSAVAGDVGYLFTAELRHTFPANWHGQWQAIAFFDNEQVRVDKNPIAPGVNSATLSGVGVGINWAGPKNLLATAYVAHPVGAIPELVGDTASVQVWLQLSKGF